MILAEKRGTTYLNNLSSFSAEIEKCPKNPGMIGSRFMIVLRSAYSAFMNEDNKILKYPHHNYSTKECRSTVARSSLFS